ncbi:DNA translocase FtsK 4TM domain-containing protein [candidate division WOR-3 bacterium]|nr:DNA translocase FtsK 4TM domain-containing protein [candidate division WOR-3 bacterium]
MNLLLDILKTVGKIAAFSAIGILAFYFIYRASKFMFFKAVGLPKKIWKDLYAITFFALSLYLFISFFSKSFFPDKNISGFLGNWLSSWGFYFFGWQSFIFLAVLFILSWKLCVSTWSDKYHKSDAKVYALTAFLLSFAFASMSILGMFRIPGKKPVDNYAEFLASGELGRLISKYGTEFLGKTGFTLTVVIFFLTTSVLATGFDIITVFRFLKRTAKKILRFKSKNTAIKRKNLVKNQKAPSSLNTTKPITIKKVEEMPRMNPKTLYPEELPEEPEYDDFIDKTQQESIFSFLEEQSENVAAPMASENKLSSTLEKKLLDFGLSGKVTSVETGPIITTIEYLPDPGIKLSKISSLSDDIAMAMHAEKVRIVAPIPGKSVVGFEIPNKTKSTVFLKSILRDESFQNSPHSLTVALGVTTFNQPTVADLSQMPHLLVAGATGSGKSVCINSIICSLISRISPKNLRFILIDPKRIELSIYNGIPHLVRPVIVEPKQAPYILNSLINWMDLRYKDFGKLGARNITAYNKKVSPDAAKPYIVAVIDELADLMLTTGRVVEDSLIRLAQMSRAVGIHLILATQRPSVNVITGLIKANFPARIAFKTSSQIDSRTILDGHGAEKLLGRGDMLFSSPGLNAVVRLHGAYISTEEARKIVKFWAQNHLEKLLKNRIHDWAKISSLIVREDSVLDAITDPEQTPGAEEILQRFIQYASDQIGIEKDIISESLSSLSYYPPVKEQEESPLPDFISDDDEDKETGTDGLDTLYEQAKEFVLRTRVASVSAIQRHFKVGYARAGRIIDQLETNGIVGPHQGSKSRDVFNKKE